MQLHNEFDLGGHHHNETDIVIFFRAKTLKQTTTKVAVFGEATKI